MIVLFGDHGNSSTLAPFMNAKAYDLTLHEKHIPLILYAPSLIKTPKVFEQTGSLVDMMPTVASFAVSMWSMRRWAEDLFDSPQEQVASSRHNISSKMTSMLVSMAIRRNFIISMAKTPHSPTSKKALPELAKSLYEMSRYLLFFSED